MQKAAVYHRPNSEMAYLKDKTTVQIRLRLKHRDVLGVELLYADPYALPAADGLWHPEVIEMKCSCQSIVCDYWQVEVPLPANRHLEYAFHLLGPEGEEFIYDDRRLRVYTADCLASLAPFRLEYQQENMLSLPPSWVSKTVWYELLVDRFAKGQQHEPTAKTLEWASQPADEESFFGGNLQGIIEHLDYLQELGVNGLYLNPIFTAYSNHKLDPVDYYNIDPNFGTKDKFKELVVKAHQRGMRVLVEVVFNHLGDFALQWQDVQTYGRKSRFADWFLIRDFPPHYTPTNDLNVAKNISYEVYGNNPHLPKLNLNNPEVKQYLLQVANYWVSHFDIDGWVLTAADEISDEFCQELYQAMQKIKSDFYIVGQIKRDATQRLNKQEFDGVSNQVLTGIISDYFIKRQMTVSEMIDAINAQIMRYPDYTNQAMLNILDSRDTPRLLAQCQGDTKLMRATLAFLFAQIGAPCLYYGNEIGLQENQVPTNRGCMLWDKEQQDETMHRFIKQLILFRRRYSDVLTKGTFEWGQCNSKYDFLSFTRKYQGQKIFALFNLGYGSVKFVLPPKAKLILSQNLLEEQQRIGQNGFVIIEA